MSPNKANNENQVDRFHNEVIDLIKKYQFRDRNQIVSFGISVSQCYVLETLHRFGDLNANVLAGKMHLSVSTITRVVDQLVKKGYVKREYDVNDRRFRIIRLTEAGELTYQQSWQNVLESERRILENFAAEHREMLIEFLHQLNCAVDAWQVSCNPK
jgi:DNA-binding MarR family transcriptional regulator